MKVWKMIFPLQRAVFFGFHVFEEGGVEPCFLFAEGSSMFQRLISWIFFLGGVGNLSLTLGHHHE